MPVSLHQNCLDQLRQQLPDVLSSIVVKSNRYVDFDSVERLLDLDATLPDHGEAVELLGSILGRNPFSSFVLDRLHETLSSELPYDLDASGQVHELELGESVEVLANRLVTEFQTLPWGYTFLYEIPASVVGPVFKTASDEYEVAAGAHFVRWNSDHQRTYETPSDDENTPFGGLLGAPKPTEGTTYLRLEHSGYVPEVGSSNVADEAERTLRAICGFGIAMRIWERGPGGGFSSFFGPVRSHVHIWRRVDSRWEHAQPRILATELGEAIAGLRINNRLAELGAKATEQWATSQFARMGELQTSDEGQAISRACRWLFDSYVGSNELLSFIQGTVSAEILLGDKAVSDITGLTELLANRCAYLVGETRSQREELLSDFREIYRTRSRIVHRGIDQLGPEDENRLWTLRWLCTRIIQKELELLLKD